MKKIFSIIERVKSTFECNSETEVANLLGISKTALANHKSRNTIPYEALFTFCESKDISIDWLFTGKGSVRKGQSPVMETGIAEKGFVLLPVTVDQFNCVRRGALNVKRDEILAVRKDWLEKELFVNPDNVQLIRMFDDTMEPTIKAGDLLFVDYRDGLTAKMSSLSDGIYVLTMEEHLMVKRLQIIPEGLVEVISDNPIYKTFTIKKEQIGKVVSIVGRVMWVGKKLI